MQVIRSNWLSWLIKYRKLPDRRLCDIDIKKRCGSWKARFFWCIALENLKVKNRVDVSIGNARNSRTLQALHSMTSSQPNAGACDYMSDMSNAMVIVWVRIEMSLAFRQIRGVLHA